MVTFGFYQFSPPRVVAATTVILVLLLPACHQDRLASAFSFSRMEDAKHQHLWLKKEAYRQQRWQRYRRGQHLQQQQRRDVMSTPTFTAAGRTSAASTTVALNMVSNTVPDNGTKNSGNNSNRIATTKTTTTTAKALRPPPHGAPATQLGTPLDDATKTFNQQFIKTAKSWLFDVAFGTGQNVERAYARFYALETIARMPYFSYLSVLHLYETLGRWRRAEYLRVHFAESWNELHHLLVMEELHGHERWLDRFVAQHLAFGYYWFVVALYVVNPTHAYHLNQCVEEEAYLTYDNFLTEHREYLESQPAPAAAVQYYTGDDLYLFDSMHHKDEEDESALANEQQSASRRRRRPVCNTLYDTFVNIRDDELEHVKTMSFLQREEKVHHGAASGDNVDEHKAVL